MLASLFPDEQWFSVSDKDPRAVAMYRRHYSAAQNRNLPRQRAAHQTRREGGIAGTGDYLALMTPMCDALFVWKRYPHGLSINGGQRGVVCSVFRNEGPSLSSALITEADQLAWQRWPGERLYTYVWDAKIRSTNPGYCFLKAGWRRCGRAKDRLTILECLPEWLEVPAHAE